MQTYPAMQQAEVKALLNQIEEQGTPLRIESESSTYYILSAKQLQMLLKSTEFDEEEVTTYTPADFGLNNTDVAAYEKSRKTRRTYLGRSEQTPLDKDLVQRLDHMLDHMTEGQNSFSEAGRDKREQLLQELDEAILRNLRIAIQAKQSS